MQNVLVSMSSPGPIALFVLIFTFSIPSLSAAATFVPADDPEIRYTGRVDFSDPKAPRLGWPGTSIRARFEGTSVAAVLDDDPFGDNYVAVSIDGGEPTSLLLPNAESSVVLASGLTDSVHEIEIFKKTEGCCGAGNFTFGGFELDDGKGLVSLPPRPSLRLEFYGDSNPAGYSCECTCDSGDPALKSAYDSFPAVTARVLGAEFHSQSWSGIGVVSGFAGQPISGVWNRVLQSNSMPSWDFADYQPHAVVINIGANDYYADESPADILSGWQSFVTEQLRPVYPSAHIVLVNAYGWAIGEPADYVHQAVENLRAAGDRNVSHLRLPWLWGQEHAVVCEQAGFADRVAAHLATELGLPRPAPLDSSCLGEPGTLANIGFERTFNGESEVADGWRTFSAGSGSAVLVEDASGAHSGARYNRLSVIGSGFAGFAQSTDAAPGETFTATAFIRAQMGSMAELDLEFKDQGQNVLARVDTASTILCYDDMALVGPRVFADGFESGSIAAWASSASR